MNLVSVLSLAMAYVRLLYPSMQGQAQAHSIPDSYLVLICISAYVRKNAQLKRSIYFLFYTYVRVNTL